MKDKMGPNHTDSYGKIIDSSGDLTIELNNHFIVMIGNAQRRT